jgi:recombination protein RecT
MSSALIRWLEKDETQQTLQREAPDGVDIQQMKRWFHYLINNDEDIQDCDPRTVASALLEAAHLGLDPGRNGHAYIIKYGQEAQLQIGYQGMIELAKRSGELANVAADVVREADEFDFYRENGEPKTIHRPKYNGDRGDIRLVYAVLTLKNGKRKVEILDQQDIEAVKNAAKFKGKLSPAWKNFEGEMLKKSAIKRALKTVSQSPEVQRAINHDNAQHFNLERDDRYEAPPRIESQNTASRALTYTDDEIPFGQDEQPEPEVIDADEEGDEEGVVV